MQGDALSLYDKARLSAMPSDITLRRLGYYAEELQPFLREYKDHHLGFQPVFQPAVQVIVPHPADNILVDSMPTEEREKTHKKRTIHSLSEKLRKVRVKVPEPDDDPTNEKDNSYTSRLRSRGVNAPGK